VDARIYGNSCDGIFHCFYLGHTDTNYHESRFSVSGNTGKTLGGGDFVVGVMKDGTITGNTVDGMFSGVALAGSAATSAFSNTVTVSGNTFKNSTSHCVQIDNTGAVTAKNIAVIGNACYTPVNTGIYLSGGADGFVISGNMIRDSGISGITIEAPANNVTVTGNAIDAVAATPTGSGITINALDTANGIVNVVMIGNLVRGYDCVGCAGIALTKTSTGTAKYVTISDNIAEANTRGISVTGSVGDFTDLVIANNNAHNNSAYDVRFDAADIKGIFTNKFTVDPGFGTFLSFTDLDTTPSIKGRDYWLSSNTGATNITTLDDGKQGDTVRIECTTTGANNTFVDGATMQLSGGANYACGVNQTITLQLRGTVWREVGRGAN
jgi:parallel beta-helix repeat protein